MGDIDELLQKLDAFCFKYQHVDCLYTLSKHRFSDGNVAKSGQVLCVMCRVQCDSMKEPRQWTECPASRKKAS